jgi:glycerol-3-phosphate dehydrogenase
VVVIGGGCNGTGVLLDASTRGLRTLLIEKDDFSSGASSKSTKLLHGGVRYLQQVFELSRKSLSSRVEKYELVRESIE